MKEGPDTAQHPTPPQGSSGETTARQNLEDEVDFLFQELQKRRKCSGAGWSLAPHHTWNPSWPCYLLAL